MQFNAVSWAKGIFCFCCTDKKKTSEKINLSEVFLSAKHFVVSATATRFIFFVWFFFCVFAPIPIGLAMMDFLSFEYIFFFGTGFLLFMPFALLLISIKVRESLIQIFPFIYIVINGWWWPPPLKLSTFSCFCFCLLRFFLFRKMLLHFFLVHIIIFISVNLVVMFIFLSVSFHCGFVGDSKNILHSVANWWS